jgi:hypothetical protein
MTKFEALPELDQATLLAVMLDMISRANCHSIDTLAQKEKRSVAEIWREVCEEAGLQECSFPADLPRQMNGRD